MAFLTCAIVFTVVIAAATVGKTQETTESIFLDTTLLPVVELNVRNIARSSATETNPSSSQDVGNTSKATDLSHFIHYQNSPIIEATSTSPDSMSTYEMELPKDSTLHSVLLHHDLASPTLTVGTPSPSSSRDASLMPSFITETVVSHSFTELLPSTVYEEQEATSAVEISEPSTLFMTDSELLETSTSPEDGITTLDANGVSNASSHVAVLKSSLDIQPNVGHTDTETNGETTALGGAIVVLSAEFATPTSWYIFETESISRGGDLLSDNQFYASPDATSTEIGESILQTKITTSDKTNVDQSHLEAFARSKRLGFVLKKRCAPDPVRIEAFEKLNEQLADVLNSTIPLSENRSAFVCDTMFHLTVYVKNVTDSDIKKTVKNLTEHFVFRENYRVEKVYLYSDGNTKTVLYSAEASEQVADNFDEYTLSERELIAYIVAGISLATLIFILLTCCCVRFLCKKQTTSLDLCDIPHLNLKLEDYKLTPIPRPTISFSEYGRELFNPSYNDHTPKLEDTILSQHHFTADTSNPGARESLSFPREMRTFGGKKSSSKIQSLDVRPNARARNSWMSNSREKLSTDFERRSSGFDNVGFRKWF